MKTVGGCVAAGVAAAVFTFPILQSADLAGAEACRYSENRPFIFAPSAPYCGCSFSKSAFASICVISGRVLQRMLILRFET
jgi:hypothetical protein